MRKDGYSIDETDRYEFSYDGLILPATGNLVTAFATMLQTHIFALMSPTKTLESPRFSLKAFKRIPATLGLIVINISVFIFTYLEAGSFDGPGWTLKLLQFGAQFNPLTLDQQWYRIFTHMFLHGGIIHIAVNMAALFSVGFQVEGLTGTKKFLAVYFFSGLASALNSLYWSLFSIGVGASGAIFGLFGFSLIINIYLSRKTGRSLIPILINFGVFVAINLLIAESVNADNAAHFGGLGAGLIIGLYSLAKGGGIAFRRIKIEYFLIPLFFVTYFGLPRYQVSYFKFFQQVIAAEDSTRNRLKRKLPEDQCLNVFNKNINQWDATLERLNRIKLPSSQLASDTFKLRKYIRMRKQENLFRKAAIQRESFVYLDSVEHVQEIMSRYLDLDYKLNFSINGHEEPPPDPQQMVKVLYDSNWMEIFSPPAMYNRIGFRDSLGRWNGMVRDYYNNGDHQMKGTYKKNKRDGIFLYYSDHKTYTSVGRYENDKPVGKWETYHDNGKIASEVFYNNSYFLKNLWDSLGNQLVIDGNGRDIQRYPNGAIATEGEYRHGLKEGYWYGHHPNGEMYYEENYYRGRLISGKSRTLNGETFMYDATSLQPMPEEGFEKFHEYVRSETKKVVSDDLGHVKLLFRVTKKGLLTDLAFEQSATPTLDNRAKEIILNGPRWLPARSHGHQAVDGWGLVLVEFY
ncbi:MAG: rhomboid family intramembrane serine protease [Cyclobacteriaceae bacterium]